MLSMRRRPCLTKFGPSIIILSLIFYCFPRIVIILISSPTCGPSMANSYVASRKDPFDGEDTRIIIVEIRVLCSHFN